MKVARIVVSIIVTLCLLLAAAPAVPALAAVGVISINPTSGAAPTQVGVSGTGFTAGSTYTIRFGAASVATGIVPVGGSFLTSFPVPILPRDGNPYTVDVVTTAGDTSNIASFSMTPTILVDIGSGAVGDTIRVTGYGFKSSTSISIYFDTNAGGSVNSDSNGSFAGASVIVPAIAPGRHAITASDGFVYTAEVAFVVGPKIALFPNVQNVGSQVTVSGTGFQTNSPINFYVDGVAVTTTPVLTDSSGKFTDAKVTLPSLTQHNFVGQDAQGNSGASTLVVRPGLIITPPSGSPGADIKIVGGGFKPDSTITLTYNGLSIASTPNPPVTNAQGSFTAAVVAPAGTAGTYAIAASDGINAISGVFTIAAGASLSQVTGPVGSNISISGTNFGAGATINVTYDGAPITSTRADNAGSFTATFKSPGSGAGNHLVVAADATNRVTLNYSITPTLSLAPTSGVVNGSATVSGNGFGASRPVTIRFDNTQVGTAAADATGTFTATFKVPASSSGAHQVTVTDGANTLSSGFAVSASVSLSPGNGFVSSNVTVNGVGFAAGKTATVSFDSLQIANATVDATGSFTAVFRTPAAKTGNHQVTATDGANSGSLPFAIAPSFSINPTSGNVGSNIGLTGTGFAAATAVTVKYDNGQVIQATTDASGGFAATFNAPASKGGSHMVSATDGASTLNSEFSMDATPPSAPAPQLPADATQSDPLSSVSWTAVTDPSGVTYSLQIATNASFGTIVVEKKGLTIPGYTLSDQEKLPSVSKDQPYYWRVKAIDQASNESPWSAPRTFYVGFVMPTWGWGAIFAVIAIALGVLGYWFGPQIIPDLTGEGW